jgi:hypothetical protein
LCFATQQWVALLNSETFNYNQQTKKEKTARFMSASFQVDAGPFSIAVQLDGSGIAFRHKTPVGERTGTVLWDKISGATLVRPDEESADEEKDERMAQLFGAEAVAKYRELHGKVGQIFVAYRDEQKRVRQIEIPAPLTDTGFLQEFQSRLGNRWLGETRNRQQVEKRLHTNPGFFKTVFVLVALVGVLAAVAGIILLGFLGPVMNLLSIQKMLLDLQDGDYVSLGYRLASYAVLFVLGYFLQRIIRSRLDALRRPRARNWGGQR